MPCTSRVEAGATALRPRRVQRQRLARCLALVMLPVLLVACTTSGDAAPQGLAGSPGSGGPVLAGEQAAEVLRTQPSGQAAADLVQGVLEAAGVQVVDDVTSEATAPVRVTRWQVATMTSQATTGGGTLGRTLDALAPAPPGAPPIPFLIAAWMQQAGSDSARFAHALLGGQPAEQILDARFPDLVVALFLADATAATGPPTSRASGQSASRGTSRGPAHVRPASLARSLIDAPCTAVSTFVHDAIAAVVRALTIKSAGSGFFGFLAAVWNTAVVLAAGAVERLVGSVTKALVEQLVGVFGALAAVQQVSSALIPWRAPLTPDPPTNRFGLGDETVTGTVTLKLAPHVLPLPPAIHDCARSVGVDLTATAKGSRITWTTAVSGRTDLATTTAQPSELDAAESAVLGYRTGTEPLGAADEPELTGTLTVSSTLRRNDVEKLRRLLATVLLEQVPVELRSLVESLARPLLTAATGKLAALVDVHSTTQVPITFHRSPPLCKKGLVDPGTYTGTIDTGLRNGAAKGHAQGTITIDVADAQQVTGSIELESSASWGRVSSSALEELAISGTTSEPTVTLVKRTMDGKDATFPQQGRTPAMKGACPASLRWDLSSLSPGTTPTTRDGFVVVATRTS